MEFIWGKLKMSYHIIVVQLLFAIYFCVPSYVHQQLHSLDCQKFLHHNSLVFFTYLRTLLVQGFIFERDLQMSKKCLGIQFVCTAKNQYNLKQIFPEKELRGHSPNFHMHVSVGDLFIPTIDLPLLLHEICGPIQGIYKLLTDT
jgi:hypothetical protein